MEYQQGKGDPNWMVLLATWLPVFGCVTLPQVKRSFPVRAFEDWVKVFCISSSRRHHRTGFYWGVPTYTTKGFDWFHPCPQGVGAVLPITEWVPW
eukprot:8864929-Karenia_brevis.AAC.1